MVEYDDLVKEYLDDDYVQLRAAFPKLKQVCDPVAICPTDKANAKNLESVLREIKPSVLEKYSDYILLPVFLHLANTSDNTSNTVCSVLECLKVILEHIEINNDNKFWKIYRVTFQTIFSEEDDDYASKLPEELKLLVIQCLSLLIRNSTVETLKQVYTYNSMTKLSVVIYHCVQLAKKEKFVELKVSSLQCIQCFLQLRDAKETSTSWRHHIADLAMLVLPGVVNCATTVATSSDVLNHKVIVESIRLWGRIVGLVMEDRDCKKDESQTFRLESEFADLRLETDLPSRCTNAEAKDKDEQLASSGKRLVVATEKILSLQHHDHWKVRKQLCDEIEHILLTAPKNMHLSVKQLIDTMITFSQDANEVIANASKVALKKFSQSCELDGQSKKLVEIVEESFYLLVTKLPRILHGFDLSLKERQLSLLCGYMDILGAKHLPGLISSSQHLSRLLMSLYTAACLDCSNVCLLEEQAVRELDQVSHQEKKVWITLKHSNTPRYHRVLQSACRRLFVYSDSGSIANAVLDDFENQTAYRKEITLLLIFMISPDPNFPVTVNVDLTEQMLNTFLDQKQWDLPISVESNEDRRVSQSNIVQICLLTELVAVLAITEGPDSFTPHLLRCFYPLLECAGSPFYVLSSAGFASVGVLAKMYGGNVGNLVAQNVDYLSYNVTMNLRRAHRNPKVLSVLSVIMNYSTFDVFAPLYEIVKDVLVQSCDTFQDRNATHFLHVFLTFVTCLCKWENLDSNFPSAQRANSFSLWDQFYDYYKTSLVANKLEVDETINDEINQENIDESTIEENYHEESKVKIPDHITLTIDILNRALHFLPSKDVARQILVLQILEKGVLVLSKWRDQFLPMVHKIWSPLVRRFSVNSDALVIRRSFILLRILAFTSKEFIRTRTLKEVIPFLNKYLSQQADIAKKERSRSSYKMTQTFKLILMLLRDLGDLAVSLDLAEGELEQIVESIVPYLSCLQPVPFQEAAIAAIQTISNKDPHVVWTQLMATCPNATEFTAHTSSLSSFKVESGNGKEFQSNVHTILSRLV